MMFLFKFASLKVYSGEAIFQLVCELGDVDVVNCRDGKEQAGFCLAACKDRLWLERH